MSTKISVMARTLDYSSYATNVKFNSIEFVKIPNTDRFCSFFYQNDEGKAELVAFNIFDQINKNNIEDFLQKLIEDKALKLKPSYANIEKNLEVLQYPDNLLIEGTIQAVPDSDVGVSFIIDKSVAKKLYFRKEIDNLVKLTFEKYQLNPNEVYIELKSSYSGISLWTAYKLISLEQSSMIVSFLTSIGKESLIEGKVNLKRILMRRR
jgi:hypothetical protein